MGALTFLAYCLLFLVLLVLSQDIHIFPGAFFSKLKLLRWRAPSLPAGIQSFMLTSSGGAEIEVWHYPTERATELSSFKALIFHGNGGSLEQFIFVQMWLGQLGISSYSFDYRGFGRSSGWPSEQKIYADSDAVADFMREREHMSSAQLIVVGISIGSAPATRTAERLGAKLLILSSAFKDLRSTVRAQPLIGLLAPFVWYRFPTDTFLAQLTTTDVVLCVGGKDRIVPPSHAETLQECYRGTGRIRLLSAPEAGHNLAFFALKDEIEQQLQELLITHAGSVS